MVASRDKGRLVAKLLLYLPNFFCLAWRIIAVEESVMIKKKKKKKKRQPMVCRV